MSNKSMRVVVALVTMSLGVAALADSATARQARPDLHVTSGSVGIAGTTVTAAFTVKARGPVRVRRSTAALSVAGVPLTQVSVKKLRPGKKRLVSATATLPAGLTPGPHAVQVCVDALGELKERSETNNWRDLGNVSVVASSVPTKPIPYETDKPFLVTGAGASYWTDVPASYDGSHQTPTELLVWMHGCGGDAEGDTYLVSPGGTQSWISLSLGGRDGACWDVDADPALVLAALADVKTHFNIDPRRVVIGGYSSGGDLAYRTAFFHANLFAGLIAENTSPFRDTGSSPAASLAAATWRFNVVQLAHTSDEVYPIAGVRDEVAAMRSAGFPVTLTERPGTHYDEGATDADLRTYLLPALGAGWVAPAT